MTIRRVLTHVLGVASVSIAFDLLLTAYMLQDQWFALLLVTTAFLPGFLGVRYIRALVRKPAEDAL